MLMSASFSGIRFVRGIKRGVFDERRHDVPLLEITGIASRTEANVNASHANLDEQLTTTNNEAIPSNSTAITISRSELLNESRPVVAEVASAPTLHLTVVDAANFSPLVGRHSMNCSTHAPLTSFILTARGESD